MSDSIDSTVYVGRNGNRDPVTVEIRWDGNRLGISGRCREPWAVGQVIDELRQVVIFDGQLTEHDRDSLADIWDRWHLNDMRPGCEHQRAAGWQDERIDPDKPADSYGIHFDGQSHAGWNLAGWVRPDEHPRGLLTKPCPECGYRYGTEWKREDVPADVIAELRRIADLA